MREASALVLAARLHAEGATVRAYDPVARQPTHPLLRDVHLHDTALDAIEGADAVVLVTEWPEFSQLDWNDVARSMRGNTVIDGRNALDPQSVAEAGLTYEGIGRQTLPARSLTNA
jgi:UDPglucose 6-dehydrogenase